MVEGRADAHRKRSLRKKAWLDAVNKKQKHLSSRQLHNQMSQDRQAVCSYLILSVFFFGYVVVGIIPRTRIKVKMRAFFIAELSDSLPKSPIITPPPTLIIVSN